MIINQEFKWLENIRNNPSKRNCFAFGIIIVSYQMVQREYGILVSLLSTEASINYPERKKKIDRMLKFSAESSTI